MQGNRLDLTMMLLADALNDFEESDQSKPGPSQASSRYSSSVSTAVPVACGHMVKVFTLNSHAVCTLHSIKKSHWVLGRV